MNEFPYGGECARECGNTPAAKSKKPGTTRSDELERRFKPPSGPPQSGWVQPVAGANVGGRIRFALERFGSPRHSSHVAQLFSLGIITRL